MTFSLNSRLSSRTFFFLIFSQPHVNIGCYPGRKPLHLAHIYTDFSVEEMDFDGSSPDAGATDFVLRFRETVYFCSSYSKTPTTATDDRQGHGRTSICRPIYQSIM